MRLENVLIPLNVFVGMGTPDKKDPQYNIVSSDDQRVKNTSFLSEIDIESFPNYKTNSHQSLPPSSSWKRSIFNQNTTQLNSQNVLEKRQRQNRMLNNVRFAVQKVCLPLILIIGIPGNLFTLIILSRSHMKSSTNLYLSALALADLCYLIFHFVLSLQHYGHLSTNYWYLSYLVAGYPLTDIFSNASVWIVVSFTAERFLVIYNPIKGKVWCTVARAKRIVVIISLIAIIGTLPTFFERRVAVLKTHISPNMDTSSKPIMTTFSDLNYVENTTRSLPLQILARDILVNQYEHEYNLSESYNKPRAMLIHLNEKIADLTPLSWNATVDYYPEASRDPQPSVVTYILSDTKLFLNKNYQKSYFWFTSIFFCVFPLTLLCIFNSLLIIWIRKSTSVHKQLNRTWTTRDRQGKRKGSSLINNQETRITYMLIIVVLVFTLCQLPSAMLLLAFLLNPANQEVVTWRLMNNFANLLVAIHACLNFVLYCLLSRKFRLTFSKIFLPCLKFSSTINWAQESKFFRDASQKQKTIISQFTLRRHFDNKHSHNTAKEKLMRQSISWMQTSCPNGHESDTTLTSNGINDSVLRQHSKHGNYSGAYEMVNRHTLPHIHQNVSTRASHNTHCYKPTTSNGQGSEFKCKKIQWASTANGSSKLTPLNEPTKANKCTKNKESLLCRIRNINSERLSKDTVMARTV